MIFDSVQVACKHHIIRRGTPLLARRQHVGEAPTISAAAASAARQIPSLITLFLFFILFAFSFFVFSSYCWSTIVSIRAA